MNQLKAGGKAIIINAKVIDNIGREVILVEHTNNQIMMHNRLYIRTLYESDDNWVAEGDLLASMRIEGTEFITRTPVGLFPANCLIPVGEDPDEVTEQAQQKDAAPA